MTLIWFFKCSEKTTIHLNDRDVWIDCFFDIIYPSDWILEWPEICNYGPHVPLLYKARKGISRKTTEKMELNIQNTAFLKKNKQTICLKYVVSVAYVYTTGSLNLWPVVYYNPQTFLSALLTNHKMLSYLGQYSIQSRHIHFIAPKNNNNKKKTHLGHFL